MKMQKTVSLVFAFCLALPFVLVTDLYPFYRFGMFSEPTQGAGQRPALEVQYTTRQGKNVLNPSFLGLNHSVYSALLHSRYQRGEVQGLLKAFAGAYGQEASDWVLAVTGPQADTLWIPLK